MKYSSIIALAAAFLIGSVIAAEHSIAQQQGAAVGSSAQQEGAEPGRSEGSAGKTDRSMSQSGARAQGQKGSGSMAESTDSVFIDVQQRDQARSSELIGRPVATPEGEQIGDIGDLLLDEDGRLVGIVVSVGGFLGIGAKQVAMSWDAVQMQSEPESGEQIALVDVSKEELEQARSFKTLQEQQREQERARAESQRRAQEQSGQGTGLGGGGTSTAPGT